MQLSYLAGLSVLYFSFAASMPSAIGQEATEVLHSFTAASERAAMKEIADRFNAAGGRWIDDAVAGPMNVRREYTTRMLAARPPQAYTTATNRDHNDFAAQGLIANLDEVAIAEHWKDAFPPEVVSAISGDDGHFYVVPLNLNVPGFLFYNRALFDKLGIEAPRGYDDAFFAGLAKLKAAGVIPIAFSADAFNIRFPFESIMLAVGGRDLWYATWRDHSKRAIRGSEMRKVLQTFIRLREYVDEGSTNRAWNLSSALLINGQAGIQITGDWAEGEFKSAGLRMGADIGCAIPGPEGLIEIHGDVLVFPKQPGAQGVTGQQKLLASVASSADALSAFSRKKGGFPARIDAPIAAGLDPCTQLSIQTYRTPGKLVANPRSLISSQMDGEYRDLMNEFWGNPDLTVDEIADRLSEILHAK